MNKKYASYLSKHAKITLVSTFALTTLTLFSAEPAEQPKSTKSTLSKCSTLSYYLEILQKFPKTFGSQGCWKKGEIEVVTDPAQIKKIQNQTKQRLISKNFSEKEAEEWSTVGIVAEDSYWMWVRDAVIFPSGVFGTYDRMLWKSALSGPAAVGVLPVLSNKKVVVNLSYRHSTRSWEFELPRGQRKQEESVEQAARRELLEETGYYLEKETYLGTLASDMSLCNSLIPIFLGKVSHSGNKKKEFSEAIIDNPSFTLQQLKEGFSRGYIEYPINGQLEKVFCRDTYLSYALFQAEIKGLL